MPSEFIKIGETRIKRSNIKTFGVSKESRPSNGVSTILKQWERGDSFFDGIKNGLSTQTVEYLYITTYQGDNYKFYEHNNKIKEIIKDLES